MTQTSGRVLVTGASGDVGAKVLARLVNRGAVVRAVSRRSAQVETWRAAYIDAVTADSERIGIAMKGCEQVYLLSPVVPDQLPRATAMIDAAVASGVQRIILHSAADAHPLSPVPWASAHARAEAHLKATGLPHVILRPSAFMSNLLHATTAVRHGALPHTTGAGSTGWIDTEDIAACAVEALLGGDEHTGQTYVLTGQERLSMPDVARRFSVVLRRNVVPVFLPAPLYRLLLRATGADPWLARALVAQYADVVRSGRDEPSVTDTVEQLLGRKPTTVEEWIRRHHIEFDR